jgi:hypothetical protein
VEETGKYSVETACKLQHFWCYRRI